MRGCTRKRIEKRTRGVCMCMERAHAIEEAARASGETEKEFCV
jgi:hypothetical protein